MSQNITNPYPYSQQPRVVKKMPGWGIALVIVSLVLFFIGAPIAFFFGSLFGSVSAMSSTASASQMPAAVSAGADGYVAVLHIEGTISSASSSGGMFAEALSYDQNYLLNTVSMLTDSNNNRGILLFIDSPGGEVYATDELYLALMDYKEQTGRPIYAYCASMAASGGYYLACAADEIYINRNGMTGSIGVTAGTMIDISGFLEEQGIETTSIYVGKNKTMGSYFEEFTEEQKEIYTSVLEETYDQFVGIVAESRGMSVDEVTVLADGRIYSPKQALASGLVDDILTYEEAQAAVREAMDLSDDAAFVDFESLTDIGLSSIFGAIASLNRTDLDSYLSHLDVPVEGPAYYYPG